MRKEKDGSVSESWREPAMEEDDQGDEEVKKGNKSKDWKDED